jgi:hypothetical protein
MQGIFVALLALVCLNVTILVYTRTATRQAEIGVRMALGASRGRIVTQLFIEAFVLSAVAALAGVAIAALGLASIGAATLPLAAKLPFWVSFRLSPEGALYAVALSVVAAAIVGIAPGLQATGRGLQAGFRIAEAGGMRLGRTWTILIIAQVGFAVALLPPAVSSAWEETRAGFAGLGFAAEEFLSAELGMDFAPGTGGTAAGGAREFTRRFASRQTELMRRIEAESRVSGVTFSMFHPGDEGGGRIEAEQSGVAASGSGIRPETEVREVRVNRVDVNFFRAFEVPILAGRGFEPADVPSAGAGPSLQNEEPHEGRAVVVNLSFAQKIFAGHALGRRIRYVSRNSAAAAQEADSRRWYEIVGIVPIFPPAQAPECATASS